MANSGVKYPATTSTIQESGDDNDWTTPSNVGANDGSYAQITAASFDSPDVSYLLRTTNYSMGVPADAVIDGIVVEIERHYADGICYDVDVNLTKDGTTRVGSDYSAGANFLLADTIVSFGGATDKWGTTWTAAEVNASTFGLFYKMGAGAANADGFLDFIRITVYYHVLGLLSAALATVTSTSLNASLLGKAQLPGVLATATGASPASAIFGKAVLPGALATITGTSPTAAFLGGGGGTPATLLCAVSQATAQAFNAAFWGKAALLAQPAAVTVIAWAATFLGSGGGYRTHIRRTVTRH